MARVPKYLIQQEREEELLARQKKATEKYAIQRLFNKSSNLKIFETISEPGFDRLLINYIHVSNNQQSWKIIADNVYSTNYKFLLSHILSVSDNFITSVDNVMALRQLANMCSQAVRPLKEWKPKRNSPHLQFYNLVEHLFAKYETPRFLINGFIEGNHTASSLYVHLGAGNSLKTYSSYRLPELVLNKKTYKYLFDVPEDCNLYQGLRYAQILSMGGNDALFRGLMDSELRSYQPPDEFWVTVIDFFIKSPMFDYSKINQIIDYIRFKRLNSPAFTMKHRTIASILQQSERWHEEQTWERRRQLIQERQIAREQGLVAHYHRPTPIKMKWNKISIGDYSYTTGGRDKIHYEIVQLNTSDQLFEEGKEMRNCVASYSSSCNAGAKSIFSLRKIEDRQPRSLVTMEVVDYKIVQAKAKGNSPVPPEYLNIIKKWADREALSMSKYGI